MVPLCFLCGFRVLSCQGFRGSVRNVRPGRICGSSALALQGDNRVQGPKVSKAPEPECSLGSLGWASGVYFVSRAFIQGGGF